MTLLAVSLVLRDVVVHGTGRGVCSWTELRLGGDMLCACVCGAGRLCRTGRGASCSDCDRTFMADLPCDCLLCM